MPGDMSSVQRIERAVSRVYNIYLTDIRRSNTLETL
jgi:hypothetical protein